MLWTAARSSCSRKVRSGQKGGSHLHHPALTCLLLILSVEKLIKAKLEDVKRRLCALGGPEGSSILSEGLFLRSQEAAAAM